MDLNNKTYLITGSARRVGKALALGLAKSNANVVIHHGHSPVEAEETAAEIRRLGRQAWVIQNDLADLNGLDAFIHQAWELHELDGIIHNASIFEATQWDSTGLADWQRHMDINLTAPFLLTQTFAKLVQSAGRKGRVVNILDWRALRPGKDHFPYTISKAGLAALTQSYARALAPDITVNGLALGAILPPMDASKDLDKIINVVPAHRWANLDEVCQTLIFLLGGPEYITGEIIHIDGGRHLV